MKIIPLTRGMVAVVDNEDFDFLVQWSWHALKSNDRFYAARGQRNAATGKSNTVLMHRQIAKAKSGEKVDHKDGNTLDNRKGNLRGCNQSQNLANSNLRADNTSGLKGVGLIKSTGRWRATIQVAGRYIHIGNFATSKEAALAYDSAAQRYFSDFALTNEALGFLEE